MPGGGKPHRRGRDHDPRLRAAEAEEGRGVSDAAMLGSSGYARVANDAYFTPEWCTEALLRKVRLRGAVWEPACGDGAICRVLDRHGYRVVASDIADYGYPSARADFLQHGRLGDAVYSIVTNPPYEHAEDFVRHALNQMESGTGPVAMLLRHEWDCAGSRRDLFERAPFARKITLTKRPRWSEENKASPRHNFAWFVWDFNHRLPPLLEWAP
jgi:hypothetical protein